MSKKIAVTGGIGSGKSTVARFLRDMKYPVFSCDEIYDDVIKTAEYVEKIAQAFPTACKNGVIDRKKLAEIIFTDEEKRKRLNSIAHPFIMGRLQALMDAETSPLVFAEVPLLFEGNYQNQFDGIIVVLRNAKAQIKAICERDKISEEEATARIRAQFDYSNQADYLQSVNAHVLLNDGSLSDLKRGVEALLKDSL